MKKLLFVFLAAALIFSCQKKDQDMGPATADVVFGIQKVDPNDGLKATPPPTCPTDVNGVVLVPDHAEIYINDGVTTTMYSPTVFELNGMLYTQAIKLPAANGSTTTYTVEDFLLFQGTTLIMATPGSSGDYSEYVTKTVPFNFDVEAFEKAEEPVEVLCYLPETYEYFGFTWFEITEIVLREFCFFGDICLDGDPWSPDDYLLSLYDVAQPPAGTQLDMPAIFKMHVYNGGTEVPNSPFTNATAVANYGVSAPLCVQYPDKLNVQGEVFTFELYILVKNDGGTFSYQWYHTFSSTDDSPLDTAPGADNVVDFVVGSCNLSTADLQLSWLAPLAFVTVQGDDLADDFADLASDPSKWFFYNDETDVIDNSLGTFVIGPGTPPAGSGSAQMSVTGTQRRNIATYQFSGIPLANITTFAFSTYNPSAGNGGGTNRSGYLNFNVDFDGSDNWQKRLAFVPNQNGTVVQDTWQEWDVINGGNALWWWSGFAANGNQWPDGNTNQYRTWNDLLTSFPSIRVRVTDSWVGVRVGEPYASGYTENVDAFKFGTGSTYITYDFEP